MRTLPRAVAGAALSVSFCATAIAAAPVLTPDRSIESPVIGPAALYQDRAALAFGGGTYMAVWRSLPPVGGATRAIYASRLPTSGTATDAPPFVIVRTADPLDNPAIAFDGTHFVVTWLQQFGNAKHIMLATVTTTGSVGSPVELPGAPSAQVVNPAPVVAAGGGKTLALWQSGRLHAVLLSGTTVDQERDWPAALPTSTSNEKQKAPAVAFGTDRFLVAWVDEDSGISTTTFEVFAVPMLVDGTVGTVSQVSTFLPPFSSFTDQVAVGFGASRFLVAYGDLRFDLGSNDFDIVGRLYDQNGAPLAGSTEFLITGAPFNDRNPQIAFNGTNFLAVAEAEDPPSGGASPQGALVTPAGVVSAVRAVSPLPPSSTPILPDASLRPSALASNGSDFMLAWRYGAGQASGDDVVASPIPGSNTGSPPVPGVVTRGPNLQRNAVAATNDTVYLVVWEDTRATLFQGVDIYGMRVDANGQNLDAQAFPIAQGVKNETHPVVAGISNGDFLVAWVDAGNGGDIRAARVPPAGAVRDAGGLPVTTDAGAQADPTVAAAPDGWLVAWSERTGTPSIASKKISSGGAVPGTATVIAAQAAQTDVAHPTASFDGTLFLVAFEQQVGTGSRAIAGAWLSQAGALTGNRPTIASGTVSFDAPAAAGSMGKTVVAWHQPSATAGNNVVAARALASNDATPSGAVKLLADLAGTRNDPRVAMTGTKVLVGWTDGRSSTTGDQTFAVRARINASNGLDLVDGIGGFAIVGGTPPVASAGPSLAILPSGKASYSFGETEALAPDPVSRIHVRFGGVRSLGDLCDSDSGCDSGHCANSVCCENACNDTCQQCDGAGSCNLAPQDDPSCGTTDCSGLGTECVDYVANARCEAFGVCRLPGDPEACMAMPKANGAACVAIGCTSMGGCMDGACVCGAFQPGSSHPSVSPQFANPGCAVGGGGDMRGLWFLLVFAVALCRRRIAAALAILFFAGCTDDPGGLILQLDLTGQSAKVDHVRFILEPTAAPGFPMNASAGGQANGVTVFATDVDGDGIIDEVIDVDKAYVIGNTLSVELTPRSGGPFGVGVRAWAIDASGNRFAQAPAMNATVKPGETPIVRLALSCLNPSCSPTAHPIPIVQSLGEVAPPPAAIAAGHIRTGANAADVVVGFPGSPPGMGTQVIGEVRVMLRPVEGTVPPVRLVSMAIGDRFGAAVATGDFEAGGVGSVIIGAPGASSGDGGVYVINGGDWATTPAVPSMPRFSGQSGEQLGSALAVADVDGDGTPDIVAGAPFGKAVYVFRSNKPTIMLHGDTTGFGSAVAASTDGVLVGAPEANRVYLYRMNGGNLALTFEWNGTAGAFGAAVALADIDGDGRTDLVASAPAEGAGVVYVLRATDQNGTTGTVSTAHSAALRSVGTAPLARLGAGVAVLRGPRSIGDMLAVAAPGSETNGYLVAGATLLVRPYMAIDDGMAPIAARVSFMPNEDVIPLVAADVDGDSVPDLAMATSQNIQIVKGVAW